MRLDSVLLLVALLAASPLAGQTGAPLRSLQPLPASLAPLPAAPPLALDRAAAADPLVLGGVTGMVVGAATGGLYGAFVAKECEVDAECDLSPEYKTVVFTAIGGALGGIIGAAASAFLNR